ncbi:MAG: septal ring lytic transglycosylase RlpA family protein [bacterium]
MSKIKINYFLLISVFVFSLFFSVSIKTAKAEDFFDFGSINGDYTWASPKGDVKFSVTSNTDSFSFSTMMIAGKNDISSVYNISSTTLPADDLYLIKFLSYNISNASTSIQVSLRYTPDNNHQEVYFYDTAQEQFVKINSQRNTIAHTLSFIWPGSESLIFGLFNEPSVSGRASWYTHPKYKNDLIAASTDFAINSKVKVTSLTSGKSVIVTIKDYGPKQCNDWTAKEKKQLGNCQNRILDLSKNAFKVLAPLGAGIIQVMAEPVVDTN